ncbi:tripartite tricarboxylate transporter substrate binding protein [Bordetella genomosp. 13]|uniref:tripartite tricarboxylate transporter substrate binding protein n=1 Tax=Bordetella genomosp. 13 TaxID=463040 RepID=UPI0011A7AF9D|nr:tripartite tricarboxylate transporter substrate binding protein [Bordetella genomosp. 13]
MKTILRRAACTLAVLAISAAVSAAPTAAAPTTADSVKLPELIRIVVPFSPGASNDVFGRALGERMSRLLGVNVVVENKPGAGGVIGASDVARSKPDGSALLFSSVSFATKAATDPKLPYDATKAFAPVALVARGAMVMVVGKSTPYTSAKQVIDYARANRGKLNYGSAGIGSIGQMSTELLNAQTGAEMVHVPYKGITNAVTDMIGGRLETMITTPASVSGPLASKDIRALAVTSPERSKFFPDLPTVAESVPGYSVEVWWGMYAPAGTPAPVVARLNAAIREASHTPEMQALFAREATEPTDMDPKAFAAYTNEQLAQWRKLASDRHIVASE